MTDPRREGLGPQGKDDGAPSSIPRQTKAADRAASAPFPSGEPDELSGAARVPEWLTSFLDGEASGEDRAKAKQALAASGELKKEAEELQRAWDLLDFLPKSDSEPEKSRATMELVLARVAGDRETRDEASDPEEAAVAGEGGSSEPLDSMKLGLPRIQAESGSHLDRRMEHPYLSSTVGQRTRRAYLFSWFKHTLPLAAMGICGIVLGLLALGGWNSVENRRREKLQKIQGVVENLQLLREAGNVEFLEAIGQSDLFGQAETGAARE